MSHKLVPKNEDPSNPNHQLKTLVGNIANQKYEAINHVKRHLEIIKHASPTRETARWRDPPPSFKFSKAKGRYIEDEKRISRENQFMNERLYDIVSENRRTNNHEHAPGWRVGGGGAFIDCYPNMKHPVVVKTKARMTQISRDYHQKELNRENEYVHDFIQSAKSSYERDKMAKFYKANRVMYNVFLNRTSHTPLHLGLVKAVKTKYPEKEFSVTANHYDPNAAPDSFIKKKSQSISQSSQQPNMRPKSAPDIRQKLDTMIKQPSDWFQLKEVVKELRYGQDWDPSPNDNLFNSNYNNTIPDIDKNSSIYAGKRSAIPEKLNYLNDQPNVILMQEKQVISKSHETNAILAGRDDNRSRPKSASAVLYQNSLKKTSTTSTNSTNSSGNGKDAAGGNTSPGRMKNSSTSSFSSSSRDSPKTPPGQHHRSTEDGTPIVSSMRGMKKLGNMRKNVSFQEDINIIEFIESQQQLERAEAEAAAAAMALRLQGRTQGDSNGVRQSLSSDTADQPNGYSRNFPPERRLSSMSDISFEFNLDDEGEYHEYDEDFRHSMQAFPDNAAASFPPLVDITPESLMQQIGIELQSQFKIPIKCIAIQETNEIEKEVKVIHADTSVTAEKRKVGFMIYDVGYYLPGNEEMASYQPIYEQKTASNNGNTVNNVSTTDMTGGSNNVVVPGTPNASSTSLQQPTLAHPELFQHGISLPTTTGLLVVIYSSTDNSKAAISADTTQASSNRMKAQGIYLSINQLITLAQKHGDSPSLVVLSEMNAFAYQHNPVPKPLNKNVTASAITNMVGQLKSAKSGIIAPPKDSSPGPNASPAKSVRSNSMIIDAAGLLQKTDSLSNMLSSPNKLFAGAKKILDSAKAEAKAKGKHAEDLKAKEKPNAVEDNGNNKLVIIDKDFPKAIIYPCMLDVADTEETLSLMNMLIKHSEITITEYHPNADEHRDTTSDAADPGMKILFKF